MLLKGAFLSLQICFKFPASQKIWPLFVVVIIITVVVVVVVVVHRPLKPSPKKSSEGVLVQNIWEGGKII